MSRPVVLILTEDSVLRRWVLAWDLDDAELHFYDDISEALAAARKLMLWVFLWDARGHEGVIEGVSRKIVALPGAPELLLVIGEGEADGLGLPLENVHRGVPEEGPLHEQLERLLRLEGIRRDSGIVGNSPVIRELIATIAQVAPLEVPVLIQGESGTGKELVARALHAGSDRAMGPFVSVNVGSLTESLLESELFGHEKGAFTGAVSRHQGVFERAHGGTLFLDEVGEMPLSMQVKLLRILENKELVRVGGREMLRTDVRLITATHRRLEDGIEQGHFRGDLYYRLKVVKIELPPLRKRREDIPVLAQFFLNEANESHGLRRKGFTREATERLLEYGWPGNVRELRNVVNSMAVLGHGDYLGVEDLPAEIRERNAASRPLPTAYRPGGSSPEPLLAQGLMALMGDVRQILERLDRLEQRLQLDEGRAGADWGGEGLAPVAEITPLGGELPQDLEGAEKAMILASLRQFGGNRRRAAEQLGISERTLYRKLKRYGIG